MKELNSKKVSICISNTGRAVLSMHSTRDNVIQCTSVILDGTSPLITKQKAILSSIMTPSKILTMYKVKEEPVNWLYLCVSFFINES